MGTALMWAQKGEKHADAKPLHGLGTGASVLEIVEDYDGDTYRGVLYGPILEKIYVLHCFQKKSKKGNETPKQDMKLIEKRLEEAKGLEKERATKKVGIMSEDIKHVDGSENVFADIGVRDPERISCASRFGF